MLVVYILSIIIFLLATYRVPPTNQTKIKIINENINTDTPAARDIQDDRQCHMFKQADRVWKLLWNFVEYIYTYYIYLMFG